MTLRIAGFSLLEVENLNWIKESYRLLKISKKPDRQEMWLVIRVTAIGMVAMGALGFLIKILVTSVVKPAG
ncbi:MAG: protein translocase SEC61 complex subunit gamma [Candidatus Odinarchaeota archaeon]